MGHPRYASAGARLHLSGSRTMIGVAVLATAALVCGPALGSTDKRLAADGATLPASTSSAPSTAANQPSATASWPADLAITPSKVAVAPAAPVKGAPKAAVPVVAKLTGPSGAIGALGIPVMVLKAYHQAADKEAVLDPSCKLPWWLLAGIGHTESGHAESGRLDATGTTRGKILGPRLNGGIVGDAVISDTDHGAYDGDTVYDRAVGPMQFIPSTWVRWGVDANGDGKKDPSNIFDATLAAANYLCAGSRDLSTLPGLDAAVLSYNHSDPYLHTVLAWGAAYRDGASSVSDSTLPVVADVVKVRPPVTAQPPKVVAKAKPTTKPKPTAKPTVSASATPTKTTPSASPSPTTSTSTTCTTSASPTPTPTATSTMTSAAPQSFSASASDTATPASVDATAAAKASSTSTSASPTATPTPTPTKTAC